MSACDKELLVNSMSYPIITMISLINLTLDIATVVKGHSILLLPYAHLLVADLMSDLLVLYMYVCLWL